MSGPIDSIVSVQIELEASQGSQASFAGILIAASHSHYADRVRTYDASSVLEDMVSDGFSTTEPAYLKAQAIAQQDPRVTEIKIGRRDSSWQQLTKLTPTFTAATVNNYSGYINDTQWTFSSDSSPTQAEVCTGIASAISALSAGVTASGSSGTHVIVTTTASNTLKAVNDCSSNIKVEDVTVDAGIATDLAAIFAEDDSFYGLLIDSDADAEISAAAAYAETKTMLFVATLRGTRATDASDTTDTATTLKATAYENTALIYHSDARKPAGAAWMGERFPTHPSFGNQWAYKTLSGIEVETLTTTKINALIGKGVNVYQEIGGVLVTRPGTTLAGSTKFIDLKTGIDALISDIQSTVWAALQRDLSYSNKSADIVCNEILGTARTYQTRGFLSDEVEVTCTHPDVRTVSDADRAERKLPDVNFTAQAAGRFGKVVIKGKVIV